MKSTFQKTTQNSKSVMVKKIALSFTAALLIVACKPNNQAGVVEESKQATIDSMNTVIAKQKMDLAKQKSIDSMQTIVDHQKAVRTHTTTVVQATPAEAKRKGWSRAAKGAVIGAGVGAIGGAVIDKKHRGEGAIIGGLAGAGLGAGTGAIIDSEKNKK